jgi:hypothetical protein
MKYHLLFSLLAFCLLALPQKADAQIINFDLAGKAGSGLLPGNENPAANSTGSGDANSILFDTATNELTLDVVWGSANGFSDLTGNATAMHIHGPADINNNGGVINNGGLNGLPGFDGSASSGGFTGTVTLSAASAQDLLDGNLYLNVHTADNGGGELRANMFSAVPEPSSLAILGLVGAVAAFRRRRG